MLITCHYSDVDGASDWLKKATRVAQPIRAYPGLGSENVISISALVPQTCFRGETSGTGVS